MSEKQLFRTSLVGGYNKKDVIDYVQSLENELEELRAVKEKAHELEMSVTQLLKQQEESASPNSGETGDLLKSPETTGGLGVNDLDDNSLVVLREKARKYDESYDAIKKLILDSRIEAQIILTKANQEAELIIKEAEKTAQAKQLEREQKLLEDAEQRAAKIVYDAEMLAKKKAESVNSMIALEARESAGKLQEEFQSIQTNMQQLIDDFSIRVENYLNERTDIGNVTENEDFREKNI